MHYEAVLSCHLDILLWDFHAVKTDKIWTGVVKYTICWFACVKTADSWFVSDDVELTVMQMIGKCGLKGWDTIASYLLKEGDPAILSQKYGSVVLFKHKDNMYVSIYQGITFPVKSLAEGLNNTIMMFFFTHWLSEGLAISLPVPCNSLLVYLYSQTRTD